MPPTSSASPISPPMLAKTIPMTRPALQFDRDSRRRLSAALRRLSGLPMTEDFGVDFCGGVRHFHLTIWPAFGYRPVRAFSPSQRR